MNSIWKDKYLLKNLKQTSTENHNAYVKQTYDNRYSIVYFMDKDS